MAVAAQRAADATRRCGIAHALALERPCRDDVVRCDLAGRGAVPDVCERGHYVAFVATHDDGHFQRARSRRTAGGADTSNASNIRARRTASRGYRHRH
ncbi:hypothetical protein BLAT2472_40199 [Burkholderia latens]